ncbi:MAG: GNAT family N-acetyltransferase [Bdellovibrio sp.]
MAKISFTPFEFKHLHSVKVFTDKWIGENYYTVEDLESLLSMSCKGGLNASILAWDDSQLVGVRLTLAPGQWIRGDLKITPQKWNVDADKVAYFKSLFIDESYRSQGLGAKLSALSKEIILRQGGMAVLTHSWLESPANSSQIYLLKDGFKEIARHEKFWHHIDYLCTRCAPDRCQCTAVEMIKFIGGKTTECMNLDEKNKGCP